MGWYGGGTFTKNYTITNVSGSGNRIAGIAGHWNGGGTFTDSYATHDATYGTVSTTGSGNYAAGAIGWIENGGHPARVFSTVAISTSGANKSALAIRSHTSTCSSCFWDNDRSVVTTSDVGVSKTTSEMQTSTTFTGAGYSSGWTISNGAYPKLDFAP